MLPRVLLEGGASKGCLGNGGLGLTVANFLVERDLTAGEGVLSRIVFPTGERFPTYGTKKKKIHLKGTRNNTFTLFGSFRLGRLRGRTLLQYRWKEVHDFHFPLLTCGILTCIPEPPLLLFVPLKYARTILLRIPVYQNQPCYSSCHSDMPELFCFLAYAITDLMGTSKYGFRESKAYFSLPMSEKPRLPMISSQKEVITAYQ